jgi:ribosomal protein S18 acetylase RimI-like enzyme
MPRWKKSPPPHIQILVFILTVTCLGKNATIYMVFVTGPAGSPKGYVTCHANPQTAGGSIGLIAVRADSRDAGLAGKLVTASLTWFSQQGLKTASAVTQGRNISAQRLYQNNQFVTRSLELYYHKWCG